MDTLEKMTKVTNRTFHKSGKTAAEVIKNGSRSSFRS